MPELANEPNGLNNNVSEETGLMDEHLGKKDEPDEPKKTTPSTADEGHDKETRNGGSDPNQVELTIDESSGREVSVESHLNAWCDIKKRHIIVFVVFSLISSAVVFVIGWTVKPQKPPGGQSCPSCPEDWLTWRRKCYYFSNVEGTWNSSQNNCSWHGASLFVPGPEEEMAFIRDHVGYTESWIGLWREEKGQPWKQPDGSVFNSSFEIRANGPCAYLDKQTVGSTWCDTQRDWICTKYLPVV